MTDDVRNDYDSNNAERRSESGTVKWFDKNKGYGFIVPDDSTNKDIFVHISALNEHSLKNLIDGQRVSYDIESNNGRSYAVNIRLQDG